MTTNGFPQRIRALLPKIRARREEIEAARRLPRDLVNELSATGIFKLGVPKAIGGDEADPLDIMRAIETVSAADGSTGWVSLIGISSGFQAGYMPEAGAKEVFADPAAPTAVIVAPQGAAVPVDGGFTVGGRWKFASGITHSDWVTAGCIVLQDGKPKMTPMGMPEIVHASIPVNEGEVHDTWYVSGLNGTGSNDFSAKDVFVPEQRVGSLFDASMHRPEPLYQLPPASLFAPQVSAVALGIARAALDDLVELASEKTPSFSTTRMAERPVTQIEIARAEGALGAARSFLNDAVDDIWQTVSAERAPTPRQRAMVRIAALQAVETATRVAHTASTLAGGTSIYNTSSLQRHARDAEAVTHHVIQSPQTWEDAGRVLFGLQPLFPVF
jgi:indole-3-acetate monooxygenase